MSTGRGAHTYTYSMGDEEENRMGRMRTYNARVRLASAVMEYGAAAICGIVLSLFILRCLGMR